MRKTSLFWLCLVAAGCGGEVATSNDETGGAFSHGGRGGGGGGSGGGGGGGGIHLPPPPPPIPGESLDGQWATIAGIAGNNVSAVVDATGHPHVITHDVSYGAWMSDSALADLKSFGEWHSVGATPFGKSTFVATPLGMVLALPCGLATGDGYWTNLGGTRDLSQSPLDSKGCSPYGDLRAFAEYDGRVDLFRLKGGQLWVDQSNAGQLVDGTGGVALDAVMDASRWALALDGGGKIVVVGARTDAVLTMQQTVRLGRFWSGWTAIPGSAGFVHVAAGTAADGRVTVFGVTASGDVYAAREKQPGFNDFDWALFVDSTRVAVDDLEVGTNVDGRLELFARGTDNVLYHVVETSTPGTFGTFTKMFSNVQNASVVRMLDGRLVVFRALVGGNAPVNINAQYSPGLWHSVPTPPPPPIN